MVHENKKCQTEWQTMKRSSSTQELTKSRTLLSKSTKSKSLFSKVLLSNIPGELTDLTSFFFLSMEENIGNIGKIQKFCAKLVVKVLILFVKVQTTKNSHQNEDLGLSNFSIFPNNWKAVSKKRVMRKFDYWVDRPKKQRMEDLKEQEEAQTRYVERKRRETEREDDLKFQFIQNVRSPKKNDDKKRL